MTRKEKFGKLVLLEETEASALLGTDYRAAKLGPSGLEKIVTLLRLRSDISAHTEAARSLMDQVKLAAQLQNPNIAKVYGIGKVESSYYITYEFVEGRSLQQILDRCRLESYPFAVDHALLIASKVCAALEYAHSRRTDAGARVFHGLLTPDCVLVSFEGEIRVRGFGYWPSRLAQAGLLLENERRYLAPEQTSGPGDARADIFSLGAILFETLTGQPPAAGADPATLLGAARLLTPRATTIPCPNPSREILGKSLGLDPASRYAEVADQRKAIDALLFSGDFTPTTFNLAFFMHSLFREDMEGEARAPRRGEGGELRGVPGRGRCAKPRARAPRAGARAEHQDGAHRPASLGPASSGDGLGGGRRRDPQPGFPRGTPSPRPRPPAAHPLHGSSPSPSSREAASGFTFHRDEAPRSRTPLLVGLGVIALVAAGGGWYLLQGRSGAMVVPANTVPVPTTLAPEVIAAQERVKELEQKLAALEGEKQAAEAKAADEAKVKVEAQAKAKGQEVDQAALERAQEEARQRARQDEEQRQREELRRVEEQKRAEEARLAEERRRAEEAAAAERAAQERAAAEQAALAAQATPQTTLQPATVAPAPPPPAEAPVRVGTLVGLDDPGVIGPILEKKPPLAYPPVALRQRVEGSVDLSVLVDERGNVTEARIVSAGAGGAGLPEAAADYARKWKYRPATKDGVAVKVWKPVTVVFKLP